jgi:hypothetical protein
MINFSDYTLEPLHQDGELVLYRGVHARPGDGVLLLVLVVAFAGECASSATLARPEHEYSLAAELDLRWAARPLALTRHQGRTMLVLLFAIHDGLVGWRSCCGAA